MINQPTINKIFASNSLPKPKSIAKIDVGFTNIVYSIDDRYILKVCEDVNNEKDFKREVVLYKYFQTKLPVPKMLVYDDSKSYYTKNFMVYQKTQGDNLYNGWHLLTVAQRKSIIDQLCNFLRKINSTNIDELPEGAALEAVDSWKDYVLAKINKYLTIAGEMKSLSVGDIDEVNKFVEANSGVLEEQKIALTYWDVHFDNLVVKGDRIVGLLDFERTEMASIDFVLDTVKRMVDQPKKYMSEHAKQFAKAEDYEDLMAWFIEFYPELFEFENIDRRIDLYSIAHYLEDLENWPNVQALKDNIKSIVG